MMPGLATQPDNPVARDRKSLIASCAMELRITMIASPEDPPWRSTDYQSELRDLGLTLKADGLEIYEVSANSVRSGCSPAISGEWKVKLGTTSGPDLGNPVGSWLQARHGRTVRLTIGEIEADVRTVEELVSVIRSARFYQEVAENDF
jgi:hypothetical protein